jgi:hypothetical protein
MSDRLWAVCLGCAEIRTTPNGVCHRCGVFSSSIHFSKAEAEAGALRLADRAVARGYAPPKGAQLDLWEPPS